MTDQKPTRSPRGTVQYGLMAQCVIAIPVDKTDLKAQLQIEEAFLKATNGGDAKALLDLPGARISRTERKHRFGALPKVGETAGKTDPDQADIEDVTGKEADEGGEAEEAKEPAADEPPAAEEHHGGKGRRRA